MVEKVLNIASYEKGEIQLNKKHHSINTLVDDVVDIISMHVHKKGGDFNIDLLDIEFEYASDPYNVANGISVDMIMIMFCDTIFTNK